MPDPSKRKYPQRSRIEGKGTLSAKLIGSGTVSFGVAPLEVAEIMGEQAATRAKRRVSAAISGVKTSPERRGQDRAPRVNRAKAITRTDRCAVA